VPLQSSSSCKRCLTLFALQVPGKSDAELAYARLEALCHAVKQELQNDLHIHDAAVLPAFVNLPQITAAEYGGVSCNCLT
jgi:hypothetical protein